MKKIVLILLLLALPLQMSWAAAGAYCRHEQGEQARHLGHHGHQHKDGAGQSHGNKDGKDSGKAHGDCGYCHGIGAQALFPASAVPAPARPASSPVAAAPFYYSSHIPDGPRRPDRHPVA